MMDHNGYTVSIGTVVSPMSTDVNSNGIVYRLTNLTVSVLTDFGNVITMGELDFERRFYVPQWHIDHMAAVDDIDGVEVETIPERIDVQIALLEKAKRKFNGDYQW